MPNVVSRGRALTRDELNQYYNSIGTISYDDCKNLAALLYGMNELTFQMVLGWDRHEAYELNTNVYDGYMCTCAAVNRYAGYGLTNAESLIASLRGGDTSGEYTVANMVYMCQTVINDPVGYQPCLRCTYLALANPDQRVWGFAGDGGNPFPPEIIIYVTHDQYGTPVYCTKDPAGTKTYGYSVDGGVIGGGYNVYVDNGYPTKLSEFRAKIFHALACPTMYWSKYPHNLGYWNRQGEADPLEGYYANEDCFSFDCNNLVNAILNGWYDNRTYGYFQQLTRTGDQAPDTLINRCDNVSYDFSQLSLTSVLFYDGSQYDHIGVFVGDFIRDGHTYNTIECTTAYGGGVVSTYVDSAGRKYANKETVYVSGSWLKHGLLTPWLVYDVGNIDPGGNISPVNPGGGGVNPPGWESPQLKKNMPLYMMLRNPRKFGYF